MLKASEIFIDERMQWMKSDDIRPYVFVRPENRILEPGRLHRRLDWFPHEVIYKNPLEMDQVGFADRIMYLETAAFGPSGMAMPRWVFYDCAIVPGFVAGFAARTSKLSPEMKRLLAVDEAIEWTPLSLFIIIPTMSRDGEWVAHNLCSVNSILPKEHQVYGIGFISKAFGLWYANVRTCCGMTQWTSPSVKLHSNYGDFEVLTAYTPVHSYARTVTYRLIVDTESWPAFFHKQERKGFHDRYESAGFDVDPVNDQSLISFQRRLEGGEGPFFLDPRETRIKDLNAPLKVYRPK
ncbi:MAG: hypothetical protein NDI61_11100 [Bdellovibrionaceae bacterium]|nr:hypothetical protein [Pseudobdellovibrionaceae bacterium]